jgi:hypothetical protein
MGLGAPTRNSVSVANPTISKAGKAQLEARSPTFVLSKLLTCLVPELGHSSQHQMQWIDWHSLAACCSHTFGALNIEVSTAHLGLLAENGKPRSCHRPALPSALPNTRSEARAMSRPVKKMKKTKWKQVSMNHSQAGIGHGHKPEGQGEGGQWDGKEERGKRVEDAEEEPQHD